MPADAALWQQVDNLGQVHADAVKTWCHAVYYRNTRRMSGQQRVYPLVREAIERLGHVLPTAG